MLPQLKLSPMKLKIETLLLSGLMLFFAACERDEMEQLDQAEADQALNEAVVNTYYNELDGMITEAATAAENGRVGTSSFFIPSCAAVTHNPDTRTTTIDFGATCTDARGTVRSGKIIITREGRIFDSGSSITATLEEYVVNAVQVEGTRVIANITQPSASMLTFSIVLMGGKVTWPDGTMAEREVNHQRSWMRAINPADDEWHIDGSATGTNRAGQAYTSTIRNTLIYKVQCSAEGVFIPVQGELVITRPDKFPVLLVFGEGYCDQSLVVSANGRSRTITVTKD